ncbi:MAG: phosphotransferase family protein [Bacillaceae bacterium]
MNLDNLVAIGNTAEIYRYENTIIKLFKDHLPRTESLYEAKKQEFAYSCGLDVPKIIDVIEINGRQAIVMEYIEGETIGKLLANNMELTDYYLNICVNVQIKIHNVLVKSTILESMSEKLKRQIKSGKDLCELQKDSLLRKLDSMIFEPRLCHGDFHPFNLIMSDDKVTIIDWVDSSAGDIRADVYRTYLLISQSSIKLAKMYLHIYCKKSGLSQNEILQWAPIIAGARLSEHVSSENKERLIKIITDHGF